LLASLGQLRLPCKPRTRNVMSQEDIGGSKLSATLSLSRQFEFAHDRLGARSWSPVVTLTLRVSRMSAEKITCKINLPPGVTEPPVFRKKSEVL
jgi:hypothetical protein